MVDLCLTYFDEIFDYNIKGIVNFFNYWCTRYNIM